MRAALLALVLGACALTPAPAADPMAPLRGFEGCWRGSFANQPQVKDFRQVSIRPDGRSAYDRHRVEGAAYSGETEYLWDEGSGDVIATYSSNVGGRWVSVMTALPEGGVSFAEAPFTGASDAGLVLRSTWRLEGDRFVAITERNQGDAWSEYMRIDYDRAGC